MSIWCLDQRVRSLAHPHRSPTGGAPSTTLTGDSGGRNPPTPFSRDPDRARAIRPPRASTAGARDQRTIPRGCARLGRHGDHRPCAVRPPHRTQGARICFSPNGIHYADNLYYVTLPLRALSPSTDGRVDLRHLQGPARPNATMGAPSPESAPGSANASWP